MSNPIDPQAAALNDTISRENPAVLSLLSKRGKAIFFPKLGILSQSAEAAGKTINATIGIATEDDGKPLVLPSVTKNLSLPPGKSFTYAPSPGLPDIRKQWKEMQLAKNPGLAGKKTSLPLVTNALTHGLSIAGYLFLDEGDEVILPDCYWENYDLTFGVSYGAKLKLFPAFAGGGFNVAGLRERLQVARGKRVVVLNFPNNPTGYTPTVAEARQIIEVLGEAAKTGPLLVILDDAYFGLVFEEGVYPQSLFAELCDLHPNLLVLKGDGPTKEDYVWGFRVGFLTYGVQGASDALYGALEGKTGGAVRATISNASHPGQTLLLTAWQDPAYAEQKREKFALLKKRYDRIKAILAAHPEYRECFEPLPYNSGYFMCVQLKKGEAEPVRQKLLKEFSTGVIAFGKLIRVAFSSTPTDKLEPLFENLFRAAKG